MDKSIQEDFVDSREDVGCVWRVEIVAGQGWGLDKPQSTEMELRNPGKWGERESKFTWGAGDWERDRFWSNSGVARNEFPDMVSPSGPTGGKGLPSLGKNI